METISGLEESKKYIKMKHLKLLLLQVKWSNINYSIWLNVVK